jgi:hypothetical protein
MINEGLTVVEPHSKLLYALCFKACSEHIYTLAPGLVQSTYIRFAPVLVQSTYIRFAQDLFRAYVHALRRGVYCKMFF